MFGKKTAKQMQQQAQTSQAQATQFMQQAAQPTPLQSAEDKANLDFLNWENGLNGPIDVRNAPGMSPWLDLYKQATAQRDEERMGTGLFRLGQNGANPTAVAMLDRLNAERRREREGGALAEALRQRSAAAHGYVLPSSSLTQGRQMGLASLSSANAGNAWQRYLDQQARSGFLNSPLFGYLMQGASTAATAGLGQGGRWGGTSRPTGG